jgi:carbohydrate-selective porin OprB
MEGRRQIRLTLIVGSSPATSVNGKVSKFIPGSSAEQLIEVNYQWRHSRYLIIIPQFQYIWKPSGRDLPGVAVAGVQFARAF